MASESCVISSKLIVGKWVCSTLKNYTFWTEPLSHSLHNVLVDLNKAIIVESIQEWNIDCVSFAFSFAHVLDVSSAWEEVTISMKTHRHNTIGSVEGFFNTVSMVNVDVDVEHALVVF